MVKTLSTKTFLLNFSNTSYHLFISGTNLHAFSPWNSFTIFFEIPDAYTLSFETCPPQTKRLKYLSVGWKQKYWIFIAQRGILYLFIEN